MAGSWTAIKHKHLSRLPKNARPSERGQALKDASREYRGLSVLSNPSGNQVVKWGLILGALYVGLKYLQGKQTTG